MSDANGKPLDRGSVVEALEQLGRAVSGRIYDADDPIVDALESCGKALATLRSTVTPAKTEVSSVSELAVEKLVADWDFLDRNGGNHRQNLVFLKERILEYIQSINHAPTVTPAPVQPSAVVSREAIDLDISLWDPSELFLDSVNRSLLAGYLAHRIGLQPVAPVAGMTNDQLYDEGYRDGLKDGIRDGKKEATPATVANEIPIVRLGKLKLFQETGKGILVNIVDVIDESRKQGVLATLDDHKSDTELIHDWGHEVVNPQAPFAKVVVDRKAIENAMDCIYLDGDTMGASIQGEDQAVKNLLTLLARLPGVEVRGV